MMKNSNRKRQVGFSLVVAFLATGMGSALFGQVYTPPAQGGQPSGGGGNNTTVVNQGGSNGGNKNVVGNDVPFLDPTTETFMFDGKAFNVNDNRLFRSRFEKYLNSAEADSEMDQAYRKSIRAIIDALSPHGRKRGENRLAMAVANLQYAAEFPQDARLCESLANAVYRIALARSSVGQLHDLNKELDRQRKQLDWNFDAWKDDTSLSTSRAVGDNSNNGKGNRAAEPTNAGHISRYVTRIAEVEGERVFHLRRSIGNVVATSLRALGVPRVIVRDLIERRREEAADG